MRLEFPEGFLWGSSTAAAQIETASNHNWKGVVSVDGIVFDQTTDHEKRRSEDLEIIKKFGKVYRCGVDWAKLQVAAFAPFNPIVVKEYRDFFQELNDAGIKIMFVFHHFTHPLWFEEKGAFRKSDNVPAFLDYAIQCIQHFSPYIFNWNTFNEPNVYAMNAYILGNFPPFKKNIFIANQVIRNMGKAHRALYKILKERDSYKPVGISLNTALFKAKNILGFLPAKISDWWFHRRSAHPFRMVDYWGLSYYAYVLFDPRPITELTRPGLLDKLGLPRDKMWAYNPEGLAFNLKRFFKKYKKPIFITENGICTDDDDIRIRAIRDYLKVCHEALEAGIRLKGYIHWSTFDNFEWHLGPNYRFGLARVNFNTMERKMTRAGEFYHKITVENAIRL